MTGPTQAVSSKKQEQTYVWKECRVRKPAPGARKRGRPGPGSHAIGSTGDSVASFPLRSAFFVH